MYAKQMSKCGWVATLVRIVAIGTLVWGTSVYGWQSKPSTKGGNPSDEAPVAEESDPMNDVEAIADESAEGPEEFEADGPPEEPEAEVEAAEEDEAAEDMSDMEEAETEEEAVVASSEEDLMTLMAAPASGIDPLMVRLRSTGLNFLTKEVIPCLIRDSLGEELTLPNISLLDQSQSFGFHIPFCGNYNVTKRFRASLRSVKVTFPVCEDTISTRFQTQSSPKARISGSIKMPEATITATVRASITHSFSGPDCLFFDDAVEGAADLTDVSYSCTIKVTGVNLDPMAARFKVESGRVVFDRFTSFNAQIRRVELRNCGSVIDILNAFGGLDALATTALNTFLDSNTQVRDWASEAVGLAMGNAVRLQGGVSGAGVAVGIGISGISSSTSSNHLTSNWNVTADATSPTATLPPYTYLERANSSLPAAGQLQAFIPLSMLDKFGYELAREDYFQQEFVVANARMKARVDGTPRATAVPNDSQKIQWRIPVRLENVGAVPTGAPRLRNLGGTLEVVMSVQSTSTNGLRLQIEDANLVSLSGSITVGSNSVPVSQFQGLIESQILSKLNGTPSHTLTRRITNLRVIDTVYGVTVGTIAIGTKYVSVPLTFTGDCPNCD